MKFLISILLITTAITKIGAQSYSAGEGIVSPWVYVYAGPYFPQLSSTATFYSSELGTGNTVNLEQDLNMPSSVRSLYLKGMVGKGAQIVFSTFNIDRQGQTTLTRTINVNGNDYSVGADVLSHFNTQLFSAALRVSFVKTRYFTAGLSLGARWMKLNADINADFGPYSYYETEKATVPVLLPGIHASVYVLPRLLIRGSYEKFNINLAGVKGEVDELNASAELYILKNLGAGVNYMYLNYDASNLPTNDFIRGFTYKIKGLSIFAALRF